MMYSLLEHKSTCPVSLGWNIPDDCTSQYKSLNRVTTSNIKLPLTRTKNYLIVNNHGFNNACRIMNNNIYRDLDQFNKKTQLNKQNTNTFTIFHIISEAYLTKEENSLTRLFQHIILHNKSSFNWRIVGKYNTSSVRFWSQIL